MRIGLFDSGVGGLTVLKEVKQQLPAAQFYYLGDTARLPYGNKAPETLKKYTQQNIHFLDNLNVDAIVVACHSASSVILNHTCSPKGTPLYNVITPACHEAIKHSKCKKVGLMATKATVTSQVYPNFIRHIDPLLKVFSQDCPLLVPLVEEGLINDELTTIVLNRYLSPLLDQKVDSLIMGCTHYPILKNEIAEICGKNIKLINPAKSVAMELAENFKAPTSSSHLSVYLTDHAPHFITHAKTLLGENFRVEFLPAQLVKP